MSKRPVIVYLGKLPPPWIGPAMATRIVLDSGIRERFNLVFLDLSDHRDVETLGKWDLTNIFLALRHYLTLVIYILRYWPVAVYIPAGQTNVGYLRDAVFILISKMFGRKVVTHLRGGNFLNWYTHAPALIKWVVRKVHPLVDFQIVLSNRFIPLFDWLIPETKIMTVPNGIEIPDPGEKTSPRKLEVLFISNFIREKGVMEVLSAAKAMKSWGDRIHFTLGGGWSEADTKAEVMRFLEDNPGLPLSLNGPLSGNEKEEALRRASIFVMPTYYINEGLPWVLIEALAWRLPILSTRHAAIPDCVEDGENGFIIEKKNAEDLVTKIKFLLEDKAKLQMMSKRSREIYEQRFTEQHFISGLEKAFEMITEKRS